MVKVEREGELKVAYLKIPNNFRVQNTKKIKCTKIGSTRTLRTSVRKNTKCAYIRRNCSKLQTVRVSPNRRIKRLIRLKPVKLNKS